jgi:tetratricopeptide (TPR) repeat protein
MNLNKILLAALVFLPASWTKVSKMNAAIAIAAESYANAEYQESITHHLVILEEFEYAGSELDFDLGLSHQYAEKVDEALGFYDKATLGTDKILASFAFNQSGVIQGNKKEYEVALSKFKSALINDPLNEAARHNYELLARWMQRDQEQKDKEQNKPEPSEFAKRKKAEADRMVEQFRFKDALSLMNDALAQDETVASYEGFIKNLQEINEIDEK